MKKNNHQKDAGRKPIYGDEKKGSHNISLTSKGWDGLAELAKQNGQKSISQFLDEIGRSVLDKNHQLQTQGDSQIASSEYLIINICEKNNPLRVSLLAFIARTLFQFRETYSAQDYMSNIRFITEILDSSVKILIWLRITRKDYQPTSTYCLLRWICFKIIHYKFVTKVVEREKVSLNRISLSDIISKLYLVTLSLDKLAHQSPDLYLILNYRYFEGETWENIVTLLNSKKSDASPSFSENEIFIKSQEARKKLREIYHDLETDSSENLDPDLSRYTKSQAQVYRYCEIALLQYPNLNDDSGKELINEMNFLLMQTISDRALDFWFSEIDHILGHEYGILSREFREGTNSKISTHDLNIKETIDKSKILLSNKLHRAADSNLDRIRDQLVINELSGAHNSKQVESNQDLTTALREWICYDYLQRSISLNLKKVTPYLEEAKKSLSPSVQ
jgi:hypothetical protein